MNTPAVKIENLVKRYKELVAVDHLNLEIREGEVFGLLGPNGSGKTTTINCLLSLLSYDKESKCFYHDGKLLTNKQDHINLIKAIA